MNPLEFFPAEVSEQIFQHLPAKSLLDVTHVSSEWNNFIGSSPFLMKKFIIIISIDFSSREIYELSRSTRKYRNISLYFRDGTMPIISLKGRRWNKVKLRFNKSIERTRVGEILQRLFDSLSFNSSVEDLKFEWDKRDLFPELNPKYEFLNLRALTLVTHNIPNWFESCRRLQALNICWSISDSSLNMTYLAQMIKNNQIAALILAQTIFFEVIRYDPKCFINQTFSHVDLNSKSGNDNVYDRDVNRSLRALVENHVEIKTVSIELDLDVETIKTLFALPQLESIKLGPVTLPQMINEENLMQCLPSNPSAMILDITERNLDSQAIKMLVSATPNLYGLRTFTLDISTIEFLSLKLQKLKRLEMCAFDRKNLKHFYPFKNLKTVKIGEDWFDIRHKNPAEHTRPILYE